MWRLNILFTLILLLHILTQRLNSGVFIEPGDQGGGGSRKRRSPESFNNEEEVDVPLSKKIHRLNIQPPTPPVTPTDFQDKDTKTEGELTASSSPTQATPNNYYINLLMIKPNFPQHLYKLGLHRPKIYQKIKNESKQNMLLIPTGERYSVDLKKKEKNDNHKEHILLLIGNQSVGKSSMMYRFLDRRESPKPTLALEYSFCRKSNQNLVKDVCHIWELGGGTSYTNLLKLNTLIKKSLNTELAKKMGMDYASIKNLNTNEELKEHPDRSKIDPLPIPLVIIGGKYDEFQNFEPEQKKVICRALRYLAHHYGASLQFYSSRDPGLVKRGHDLLSHLAFETDHWKGLSQDYNKPLFIPCGSDSLSQIAGTNSNGEREFLGSFTMDVWKQHYTTYFPQNISERGDLPPNPANDSNFRETIIDQIRARKDQELERYKKEIEMRSESWKALDLDNHIIYIRKNISKAKFSSFFKNMTETNWKDRLECLFGTQCPYKILGLKQDCPQESIRKGYHKASLRCHPDRVHDESLKDEATEKFQALGAIYGALSDPDKRKVYDETGKITIEDIDNFKKEFQGSEEEAEQIKEAYLKNKGSMTKILNEVMACTASDESRFVEIIQKWIDDEVVPAFKAFTNETDSAKDTRKRKAKSEAKRAEKALKELGVGSDGDLAQLIAKRQKQKRGRIEIRINDVKQHPTIKFYCSFLSFILSASGLTMESIIEYRPDRLNCCKNDTNPEAKCFNTTDGNRCMVTLYPDVGTIWIANGIAKELTSRGKRPHMIINYLHRVKLDVNRHINEAAQGDPLATEIYQDYHSKIEEVKSKVQKGLLLDIHGQSHKHNLTEFGYLRVTNQLNLGDYNATNSSIRSLSERTGISGEKLMIGPESLGALLENRGFSAIPSPINPSPGNRKYYAGGHITRTHGSREEGSIDCIQIEMPLVARHNTSSIRESFTAALADSIDLFHERFYKEKL
ncbi:DYNC2LI [Lepeophtheirus salmonis]|uniref:Cytoplasmic dynein 2 light intermediate chain 1 n=1 Tax=Lepeophtheirus salmonis TaxID=72036 RepID=A0A7R8H6C2_LEPSM|nr:DYNC2LI [Lepeophtheirus salmonis]CAF2878804.1 DYNC2LI [Lepeophtheirus salmonis]